ncbi:LysE type translocator [Streptomyces sp. ADI95-16]|uniref:hypothetical protein n=1 Tax=Streptomyces sp. ADI95-16 TaxID=1522758 RepID=UPI000F4341DC|nr:hypothetical protein [Streptomyces sp. ADI95-16]AYV27615.1 LysE type translocator [Streptomyces sp. ADI95-16]
MSELLAPALSGAAAGLGVAMPMGAMSVLLLQEAVRERRAAVAAAAGVAAVDLGYAALATALGPWVAAHVTPAEAWIRLAASAILLTIATRGLLPTRPAPPPTNASPGAGASAGPATELGTEPGPSAGARPEPGPGSGASAGPSTGAGAGAGRTFARYVGLTAVNPTTALYFAALTTAQGAALRAGAAGAAFVTGVALASLLWQQALVALGALAGSRISPAARTWTFRLGYGLVAAYAVKIAFPLP